MKYLKRKANQKGFTLAEMLVVVAIIAVLVSISVPVFTSKLEKARETADIANMRAARAAAVAMYLDDEFSGGASFWYDAAAGLLVQGSAPDPYGKGTEADAGQKYSGYESDESYVDKALYVTIDPEALEEADIIVLQWKTVH